MLRPRLLILAGAAIAGCVIGLAAFRKVAASTATSRAQPLSQTGDALPDVTLQTLDGQQVALRAYLGGRPALLYIFGVGECAGCSNLPLEFQIVHREAPGLICLLIGSGASVEAFRHYAGAMRLETSTLVDDKRRLLSAIGKQSEPAALLVGSNGRILIADMRSASRAAQYPMGELLHDIAGIVHSTSQTTPVDRTRANDPPGAVHE